MQKWIQITSSVTIKYIGYTNLFKFISVNSYVNAYSADKLFLVLTCIVMNCNITKINVHIMNISQDKIIIDDNMMFVHF